MTAAQPGDDILGAPYTRLTFALPDDDEGPVTATLVTRPADPGTTPRGNVLHVHGFADYFFQTVHAEWWTARGWDFHALDLRKYGRSLLPTRPPTTLPISPSTSRSSTGPGPGSVQTAGPSSSPPTRPAASPCRCGSAPVGTGRQPWC